MDPTKWSFRRGFLLDPRTSIWVFPKIEEKTQNGWWKQRKTLLIHGWFGGKTHYFWFNAHILLTKFRSGAQKPKHFFLQRSGQKTWGKKHVQYKGLPQGCLAFFPFRGIPDAFETAPRLRKMLSKSFSLMIGEKSLKNVPYTLED